MSPLSKSKSKSVMKASKDQQKSSLKASIIGGAVPIGAQHNGLGPLNTHGTISSVFSAPQSNGRFPTSDDREENSGSSLGNASKYETLSNNGSCSGESEGQKDKPTSTSRAESIPGGDADKRDKIRQKNEKKHQRQKERRAQELHERCIGFLMSKKLDMLTQKLEAMGFCRERATTALLLNDGRVEDSIVWLIEKASDEEVDAKNSNGSNMKIDISEELAKINEIEIRHNCTKQEAERAIVSCEGDLEKASEVLRVQKLENPSSPSKSSESQEPSTLNGTNKLAMAPPIKNSVAGMQGKATASLVIQQPKRDEREPNSSKIVVNGTALVDTGSSLQQTRRILSRSDWARPQPVVKSNRRWSNASSSPSIPYNGTLLQAGALPPLKAEIHVLEHNEPNINPKAGVPREPVIMMQRPQPVNTVQNQLTTSTCIGSVAQVTSGWDPSLPSGFDLLKAANNNLVGSMPTMGGQTVGNLLNSNQVFYPSKHQQMVSNAAESARWSDGSWSNVGTSNVPSSLAVPSSLGLFTGWGSASSYGSSASLDWNTDGSAANLDYSSIDWSLTAPSTPLISDSLPPMRSDRLQDAWSTEFMETTKIAARPSMSHLGRGLQEGNTRVADHASAGSCEWTTPFAGNDLFRMPRQFVTSPSLGHR